MSEQQSLIPNLNELMEEYARSEEEATPKLQIVATQQERSKPRTETEQSPQEGRKRKRSMEEIETKKGEEDKADCVR